MVSSPLQNDLLDPPSKSFYRTARVFSYSRGDLQIPTWGSFRPISMGRPFRAIYPVGRWLLAVSRWLASLVALVLLVALALRLAPISSF